LIVHGSAGHGWYRPHLDRLSRALFGTGRAARIAFRLGLQGQLKAIEHRFLIPSLPAGTALRVAFGSDFHAGPLTDPRVFEQLGSAIRNFAPDLVLLGGDFVSLDPRDVTALLPALDGLRARLGVFAVLGNHDLWQGAAAVTRELQHAGIEVLVNEARTLDFGAGRLGLYGMDEPGTGTPRSPGWTTAAADVSIVLMHSPLGLESLRDDVFDVAFCGHTHGGQIALPGGIPIVLPRGAGERRYARGEFQIPHRASRLVVSRGVGMSELPVRLFAPAEVHLCRLASPQ
jgi:predicted MPP superfamily phosphohydrolase